MATASNKSSCDVCDNTSIANNWCQNCLQYLCDNCKNIHKKVRVSQHHKIVPISDTLSFDNAAVLFAICRKHNKNEDMYCNTCCRPICNSCYLDNHKDHDVVKLEDALKAKNEDIGDVINEMKNAVTNHMALMPKLKQKKVTMKKCLGDLKTKINSRRDDLIKHINRSHDRCIKEVDDILLSVEKDEDVYSKYIEKQNDMVIESADKSRVVEWSIANVFYRRLQRIITSNPFGVFMVGDPYLDYNQTDQHTVDAIFGHVKRDREGDSLQLDVTVQKRMTINTDTKSDINTIVPIDNDTMWVGFALTHCLTKINLNGQEISRTCDIGGYIADACVVRGDELVVTTVWGHLIQLITKDGKSVSTIVDVSPLCGMGVCVAGQDTVLVCVKNEKKRVDDDAQVRKYTLTGVLLLTVHKDQTGKNILSWPYRVCCLRTSGDIFITDQDPKPHHIDRVNKDGKYIMTYKYQDLDTKSKAIDMHGNTCDDNDNVYVCGKNTNTVYVIQSNGTIKSLLDSSHGVKEPNSIAFYNNTLYVGCTGGVVIKVGLVYK